MAELVEVDTTILQRLQAHNWNVELLAIGLIVAYYLSFTFGASQNKKIVDKLVKAIQPTLKENFFQVGATSKQLIVQDNQQDFTLYATGRLRLESFLARFTLKSRQNLANYIMELIGSFFVDSIPAPKDLVTVEIKFDTEASEKFDDFIWAIVTKDNMNKYRQESYALSLTKTTESEELPVEFVFMTESPEMNGIFYTKKLKDLIQLNKRSLKYLMVTDQATDKPTTMAELKSQKRMLLQFDPTVDVGNVGALISFVVNDYADMVIQKGSLRAELLRKINKTRENEYNKVKKAIDEARKEELARAKLEEQKKLKASMTPEQQEKFEKKQKEKKQRKMMNKQKVRQ